MNSSARAENLNLEKKCFSVSERNKIASLIVDCDQCKRDLSATQLALDDIKKEPNDSSTTVIVTIVATLLAGFVGYGMGRNQ